MLAPRLRKTQLLFSIAAIVAIAACSQITEIAEKKSVQVISNADKIMMWWAGDYNNDDQIAALRKEGAPIWERGRKENGRFNAGRAFASDILLSARVHARIRRSCALS